MIANCEVLQESEASEMYAKRSESQEVVVKQENASFRVQR